MQHSRNLRDDAISIWQAGVAAVDARKLVREFVSVSDVELAIGDQVYAINQLNRIVLVGFGKASGPMAVGFEQALGERLLQQLPVVGQVNVPDDKVVETQIIPVVGCRPPGENLPTARVLEGTERMIELVRSAGPSDLCVCLISGGGSALLEKPVHPISLNQFRSATSFLSSAGASIYELNAVRRVISQVKGGGLAKASGGAPVISLIVSDVVGDNLDVIASGPTVAPTNETAAIDVLNKFDPHQTGLPKTVWSVVRSSVPGKTEFATDLKVSNYVIGNVKTAMVAAHQKAIELGYDVELSEPSGNEGDAATIGRSVAIQIAQASVKPGLRCHIMGGETTMELCDSPGQGGRNQHLVLAALESILEYQLDPNSEFCLLSGGTDGEDGNVPVAGAMIDSQWIRSIDNHDRSAVREDLSTSMAGCDSHAFFSKQGLLLAVPNTFTNVCDLRIELSYCVGT